MDSTRGDLWQFGSGFVSDEPSLPPPHLRLERVGPYQLLQQIARGGMGAVYRAHHPGLGRDVAVKLLLDRAGGGARERARFQTEARATAKLRHPQVVTVHDVGEEDGVPYLVMDLVEGGSLQDLLDREGPLAPRRAAELARALASALAHAHAAGVLHRDVKPQNVLLNAQGEPLLTDFGLAKDVASADGRGFTLQGQFLGTPGYAPPEQALGLLEQVDGRADVFSLGATLYTLLVGEAPFAAETLRELLAATVDRDPTPPSATRPDVDADLETICLRCLEKDPRDRYAGAAELADDLRRYLAGDSILARPPTRLEQLGRWLWRRRRVLRVMGGVGLGLVALMVGGGSVTHRRSEARRLARAEREAGDAGAERAAAAATRAREVEELLASAAAGLLRTPGERDDAVARLALLREPATAEAVAARLDALTHTLRTAERELLLEAAEPTAGERAAGAEPIAGLEAALADLAGGAVPVQDGPVARAQARLVQRARRQRTTVAPPDYARLLAARQERALGPAGVQTAEVACRALGRLALPGRAVPALGRYLAAEADGRRAAAAARALCRLGTAEARLLVVAALDRFGSAFVNAVEEVLPELAEAPVPEDDALQLLARARARHAGGDVEGALADADRAVALRPGDPTVWTTRARIRGLEERWAGAAEDYGRALELRPDDARLLARRGWVRLSLPDLEGARADAERALVIDPCEVYALLVLANLHMHAHATEEALELLNRAIELDPFSPDAWYQRARCRKQRHNFAGARQDYDRVIELDPHFARAWRSRGRCRRALGDLEGAVADCTRAIELDPRDPWGRLYRGDAREEQGDLDGAEADFVAATTLEPPLPGAWVGRARIRRARGDLPAALAACDEALAIDARHVEAYLVRARVRAAQGDLARAEADCTRAIALSPQEAWAYLDRAVVRHRGGDLEGAQADADAAIERDPTAVGAWRRRASIRVDAGDTDGALADLARALELDPRDASTLVERARVWRRAGDPVRARADLDRALELDPDLAVAWLHRASLRQAEGDLAGAEADATRGLTLAPDVPEAWLLRGQVRKELGHGDGARDDLKRYLELVPQGPQAEAARRLLGSLRQR